MKIFILLVLLSGCTVVKSGITTAAKVNDKALTSALFTLCKGVSIGSIRRKFDTEELSEVWNQMCKENQGFKL